MLYVRHCWAPVEWCPSKLTMMMLLTALIMICVCRFFPIPSSWLKGRQWTICCTLRECWSGETRHPRAWRQFRPWRTSTPGGYRKRKWSWQILGHQNSQNWLVFVTHCHWCVWSELPFPPFKEIVTIFHQYFTEKYLFNSLTRNW